MTDTTAGTVLVVDDEAELTELYAAYLGDEYEVRTATSGADALQVVDESVDVALLDRRMPGMSGDELLAELRDRSFDCQVAMLTAVEPERDIVDMPFDDYTVKPVDRTDLLRLVDTLLDRTAYDDRSRELFRLASKKAVLETAGNDDTDEYRRLVERLEDVRGEADTTLDNIGARAAFEQFSG